MAKKSEKPEMFVTLYQTVKSLSKEIADEKN